MNKEAIRHTGMYPDIYLKHRQTLVLSLRTAKKDVMQCNVIYFARTSPGKKKTVSMECVWRDDLFDYYQVELNFHHPARYRKYYFELQGEKECLYLSSWGIGREVPDDGLYEFLYANQTEVLHIPKWCRGQIFYQIFPERFSNGNPDQSHPDCREWGTPPTRENYMGGDLQGILDHLGYLEELGVQCVYLNPIFLGDFNHKYATTDYFQVDPIFGDNKKFRELVEKIHEKGMKIILDGVFNHTGIHFPPFADILEKQEKSQYKDWYYITKFPVTVSSACYECVGAYPYMPKLNTGNPEVRDRILKIMEFWISEYGIDGWRLDVADEVDESVWVEARILLKSKFPDILLLGETWGSGLRLMDGLKMDSIMNYTFRDSVRDFIAYEKIDAEQFDARIQRMLARYPKEMNQAMFLPLDSHDTERFLYFCQGDKRKLKLGIAFQMTFVGSPSIYYGDEVGISGENDPDCRKCMIWEEEKQDRELLEYYQWFTSLRKTEGCIRTGKYAVNLCEGRMYGFVRYDQENEIYVLINGENETKTVDLPVFYKKRYVDLKTGKEYALSLTGTKKLKNADMYTYEGVLTVQMEPLSVKVLKSDKGGNVL